MQEMEMSKAVSINKYKTAFQLKYIQQIQHHTQNTKCHMEPFREAAPGSTFSVALNIK